MALVKRLIDFQFNMGANPDTHVPNAPFQEGGRQVFVSGHRASADIVIAGGISMGNATVRIYGMAIPTMNHLSTLGLNPIIIGPNFLTILAGDAVNGMSTVFQGTITNAYINLAGMPDVAFIVEASSGLFAAIAPCPPHSYPGPVTVADVCAELAAEMGVPFINYGVTAVLPSSYFYGSARNQVIAVCQKARVNFSFDIRPPALVIWPYGQAAGQSVTEVSAETGLVGYPTYQSKGIEFTTLFNRGIGYGSTINMKTNLDKNFGSNTAPKDSPAPNQPASGTWVITGLEHNLETQTPHGSWFSTCQAARPGSSVLSGPGTNAIPGR